MLNEGMDKGQIVAVLQAYAYDISRISALIPHGSGAAKEAQAKLRQLKTAIHNDFKHRHTIARSTHLTPGEQASLERSIRDLFFALQGLGVNSNPSAEWRHALFSADLDIQRCLASLHVPQQATESTSEWF
jgi:hypothetical protein